MWLPEDREWALALHALEAESCHGCGQPRSESTSGVNEYGYDVTPVRCFACAAIQRTARKFLDGAAPSAGDGLTFHVTKE